MRRKDREQTAEFAWDVLARCPYGVLSLVDDDGLPYAVPVSPAALDGAVYFHAAKHGAKAKLMAGGAPACLVAVDDVVPLPAEYATEYASGVFRGPVSEVTDEAEKIAALRAIVEHYAAENLAGFQAAIDDELKRTAVWKISPTEVTGKARLA